MKRFTLAFRMLKMKEIGNGLQVKKRTIRIGLTVNRIMIVVMKIMRNIITRIRMGAGMMGISVVVLKMTGQIISVNGIR